MNCTLFRRACGHVDVGTCPHHVLAHTLTLSQPGGQIVPTLYWCPHQVLKATGAPGIDIEINHCSTYLCLVLLQVPRTRQHTYFIIKHNNLAISTNHSIPLIDRL